MDDFTSKQRDMAPTLSCQRPSFKQTVKPFSHQHPLRPFESKHQDGIICSSCEHDVLNSSPSACKCTNSNCDYFLHKSCLKLPRELHHKFHHHPLTLLSTPTYANDRFVCNACHDYGTAFHYNCSPCNYDLHVACCKPEDVHVSRDKDICYANAAKEESTHSSSSANRCTTKSNWPLYKSCLKLPQKLKHEMHADHPLALLSTPAHANGEFKCNACDETGTRFNYHCSSCKYDLHIPCSKMPQTVKLEEHEHPLKLFNSSILGDLICDICERVIPKDRWVYNCGDEDCDYVVEVACVTAVADTKDTDEESREKPNCTQESREKLNGTQESRDKLNCMQESIIKDSISQVEYQLRMLQVQYETKVQTETKIITEMRRNVAKLIN